MSIWDELRIDHGASIPLAAQLSQQLKWLIATGKIEANTRLPAVRKLGEQLGINLHTVRAAYQQLEDEDMVITRRGGGTMVLPYSLTTQFAQPGGLRSFSIGVVIPAFTEFYAPMLQGIQDAATDDPSLFFICNAQDDASLVEVYMEQLIARNVDGIILISREIADPEKALYLQDHASGFPPVVYADIPGYPKPSVVFDLAGGVRAATEHLIAHGHKLIGLARPPVDWLNVSEMYRGYQQAFVDARLELIPEVVVDIPGFRVASGYEATLQLLDLDAPPTAIITLADGLTIGTLQALKERGLSVPKDMAFIGLNELPSFAVIDPALTTVVLPAYEMGQTAYTLLRQVMDGDEQGVREVVLESQLFIRESCGCSE